MSEEKNCFVWTDKIIESFKWIMINADLKTFSQEYNGTGTLRRQWNVIVFE